MDGFFFIAMIFFTRCRCESLLLEVGNNHVRYPDWIRWFCLGPSGNWMLHMPHLWEDQDPFAIHFCVSHRLLGPRGFDYIYNFPLTNGNWMTMIDCGQWPAIFYYSMISDILVVKWCHKPHQTTHSLVYTTYKGGKFGFPFPSPIVPDGSLLGKSSLRVRCFGWQETYKKLPCRQQKIHQVYNVRPPFDS